MMKKQQIGRNRLANLANGYQGPRKRVLCVCSAGMLRSPTAAWVLSNDPFGYNTRAVGTSQEYALIPIDAAHCLWADEIVVMDSSQKYFVENLLEQYDVAPGIIPIHVLDIPDNYGYRDDELVEKLTTAFSDIFLKWYEKDF